MRRQLAVAAAAVSLMIAISFAIPLAVLIRNIARDRALVSAERAAQNLAPVVATVTDIDQLRPIVDSVAAAPPPFLSVVLPDQTVLGHPTDEDDAIELSRTDGRSFRIEDDGGSAVLLPVRVPDGGVAVIRSWVPEATLSQGVKVSWTLLAIVSGFLVIVAVTVADRLGRFIVTPVAELAETAERLGDGDLDARVQPSGPPEISEVGHVLNRLADRIAALLAAERELAADLSHRLRTPITALRLDVDALEDSLEKRRLANDVDDLTRAVDRLINEARRPVREGVGASADLNAIARARAEFWGALADEQGRAWTFEGPESDTECLVAVSPDDLEAALDAILGNVFAHTPDGTPYRIVVEQAGDEARLVVEDDGPGLPTGTDVLERGASHRGSTGLGLDIVRRTAEASGGWLALGTGTNGQGARVTVCFGRPARRT